MNKLPFGLSLYQGKTIVGTFLIKPLRIRNDQQSVLITDLILNSALDLEYPEYKKGLLQTVSLLESLGFEVIVDTDDLFENRHFATVKSLNDEK